MSRKYQQFPLTCRSFLLLLWPSLRQSLVVRKRRTALPFGGRKCRKHGHNSYRYVLYIAGILKGVRISRLTLPLSALHPSAAAAAADSKRCTRAYEFTRYTSPCVWRRRRRRYPQILFQDDDNCAISVLALALPPPPPQDNVNLCTILALPTSKELSVMQVQNDGCYDSCFGDGLSD